VLEVADIFREAGPAYRERFGARMRPSQLKVMRDIERCRTPVLGGHLRQCDHCARLQYSYHSCRNRHCPKCQGDHTQSWLDEQQARLLACPYYLVTFTIPDQLRALARSRPKILYGILISCAAQALQKLLADPRWLGARPGMLAVLHSWTRTLLYHPHAHFLVTAGGLTADQQAWRRPARQDFLIPCRALSVIFRAKVRQALEQAELLDPIPPKAWRRKWVVHCRHAGDGQKALLYVARYVHRVAITNSRLESVDPQHVTFRYRDSHSGQLQRCVLSADQFITRFLHHVLPDRFTKVRYYGLFSPRCRDALERARSLLHQAQRASEVVPELEDSASQTEPPESDQPCPLCHVGRMRIVADLNPQHRLRARLRAPPAEAA
jgi:hypothetical protein